MIAYLDRISLWSTNGTPPGDEHSTSSSDNSMVIKEGTLSEHKWTSRRCPIQLPRRATRPRRRMLLTENELMWSRESTSASADADWRLPFAEIESVELIDSTTAIASTPSSPTASKKMSTSTTDADSELGMCVTSAMGKKTYWSATSRDEIAEWVVSINRQLRHYRQSQPSAAVHVSPGSEQSSSSASSTSPTTDATLRRASATRNSTIIEMDVDRELERIHYACVEHAEALRQWKSECAHRHERIHCTDYIDGVSDTTSIPLPREWLTAIEAELSDADRPFATGLSRNIGLVSVVNAVMIHGRSCCPPCSHWKSRIAMPSTSTGISWRRPLARRTIRSATTIISGSNAGCLKLCDSPKVPPSHELVSGAS